MAADEKWYFTKEQLTNTPSRRCGIDADKELSYRQQAANFIQDMGQRLVVSQLCINTAIVYMHRFYVFHSLSHFHRNAIAAAALFLAAKVEEQPRKLEHVIRMAHMCLHRDQPLPDVRSEQYLEQAQDLVFNENVLLQTLGFDVAIDHPHTHVVRCCQLVKASKDLAQTSYFMASNSLHLTTMCLQYKPTVVACFCIHLACKWSNWEIPQSNEGKHWFWYVDKSVTSELLQQLTAEFLHIFDKCPSRLKRKIMSISATQSPSINHPSLPNSPFDAEPRKVQSPATPADGSGPTFHSNRTSHHTDKQQEDKKQQVAAVPRPPVDYREYREKKERERLEREKAVPQPAPQPHMVEAKHHSHHQKPVATGNVQTKHPMAPGQKTAMHHNHHHRPEMKVAQTVGQRHTGQQNQPAQSSQQREPSQQRDQRQRLMHTHGHSHQKEEQLENPPHRTDTMSEAAHGNVEKQSNNNHSVHRPVEKHMEKHMEKHQAHDKRMYDPRHKAVEHRKDVNKYQESTGKYQQEATSKYPEAAAKYQEQPAKYQEPRDRRKPELEQRCEEVRKLIEKPLPPPKPSLDPYANKPHQKYSQSEKMQMASCDAKAGLSGQPLPFPQEKSPSSMMQKVSKPMQNQHAPHGVSQIFKDTVKNGSQACLTSLSNIDDPKAEKRPREEEKFELQQPQQLPLPQQQQQQQHTPPGKQKSLFSPEKPSRESHSRPKAKQKTPPAKVPKQEISFVSPFASPPASIQDPGCMTKQQETMPVKRSASDASSSSHKRHRSGSSSGESGQAKIKIEDSSNFEAVKMLGRVPELIQPIRDNPSNGRASTELKTELKLFESELRYAQPQNMTNGMDASMIGKEQEQFIKKEPEFQKREHEFIKKEPLYKHEIKTENKTEYLSPMKSAQSISALLQEPLAPMPSLLQQQYGQQMPEVQQQQQQQLQPVQQQQLQQHQQQLQLQPQPQPQPQQLQTMTPIMLPEQQMVIGDAAVVSTVDISALSAPVGSSTDSMIPAPPTSVPSSMPPPMAAPIEEKRSEHHKSEKKKKKEKHKHKDKEKSKDKHKHKHKDKDKERHREKEKEKEEVMPAVPIKITIPKDKLNLSSELTANQGGTGAQQEKSKSPQNTSIKIIIPKERLKGTDSSASPGQTVVQGPLKIKIRTDGIRTATPASSTTGQPQHEYQESRKRERAESKESASPVPPTKKQMPVYGQSQQSQQQQRPGERQNGRHYSGSNNKEKHTSSHHKSSSKFSQSQQSHAT